MNLSPISVSMRAAPDRGLLPRVVRLSWLLFAAIAVSMAMAGVRPYIRLAGIACDGDECLPGQLSGAEARAVLSAGYPLSPDYVLPATVVALFSAGVCLLVAGFCIWRRPGDAGAALGAFVLIALGTSDFAHALAREWPRFRLPATIIQLVHVAGLPVCLCLIPDGRFLWPALRWAMVLMALAGSLVTFSFSGLAAGLVYGVAALALSGGSLLARYRRRPTSLDRSRLIWAFTAVALLAGAQLIGRPLRPLPVPVLPFTEVPQANYGFVAINGMLLLVGGITCLGVALLNDELFQVELVLNRALVYSLLSLFVVGGYVLVVGYLSVVFQSRGSLWFSLVATGVVAALFQPIREQVQRVVNQMLYGRRDDPYAVVTQLGQRLEASLAPAAVLPTIVETVATALKAPYAAIVLERGNEEVHAAAYGEARSDAALATFPLVYQGLPSGRLVVAPRAGESELTVEDRRLLAHLARHAGMAAHAVRLSDDLRRSREQLVLAREEERRRLRRDLHDGLGPALASQALTIDTIGLLLERDPAAAKALVREVKAQSQAAVTEVRRVVYGLRPPALDDLGLLGALHEQVCGYAAGGVDLRFEGPDGLPPLPAAVEVAGFRIAQEALTNVVRHAHARRCTIALAVDTALTLTISDDGIGIPADRRAGVGFSSMRERAEELGGTFALETTPGGGTTVWAKLPLLGSTGHGSD